jgi:hypothetical protein
VQDKGRLYMELQSSNVKERKYGEYGDKKLRE